MPKNIRKDLFDDPGCTLVANITQIYNKTEIKNQLKKF